MNEFEVAKKFIAQGLSKEDIATTLNGTVEIIDYLLDRTPAEILVSYFSKKLNILQETLDNSEIENVQLKKQIQTLQTKGATMAEPVQVEQTTQQWEYKKTQGENEELLNKLGEQGWEVIAPIAGYQGSTEGLLLKRPKKSKKAPNYGYGR